MHMFIRVHDLTRYHVRYVATTYTEICLYTFH